MDCQVDWRLLGYTLTGSPSLVLFKHAEDSIWMKLVSESERPLSQPQNQTQSIMS